MRVSTFRRTFVSIFFFLSVLSGRSPSGWPKAFQGAFRDLSSFHSFLSSFLVRRRKFESSSGIEIVSSFVWKCVATLFVFARARRNANQVLLFLSEMYPLSSGYFSEGKGRAYPLSAPLPSLAGGRARSGWKRRGFRGFAFRGTKVSPGVFSKTSDARREPARSDAVVGATSML